MNNTTQDNATNASGKSWLQKMKNVAALVVQASTVVLNAPVKIPAKLLQAVRYLALLAGIIQAAELKEEQHG